MPGSQKALTLRIDPERFAQLAAAAEAENRSPTNYVETLLLRDLDARDESRRVITIFAAPEAAEMKPGELERGEGESDSRYEQRKTLFESLLAIPDET